MRRRIRNNNESEEYDCDHRAEHDVYEAKENNDIINIISIVVVVVIVITSFSIMTSVDQ